MDIFSKNGQILALDKAVHSVLSTEFTYGFGVYESIRVKNSKPRFLNDHVARLFNSASIIELEHNFDLEFVSSAVSQLVDRIDEKAYNLKVLLIGAPHSGDAALYILPLKPSFPDRKLYRDGASAITVNYERYLPGAKTLNMLPSYLTYRKAKQAGAYDALLVNSRGEITEGTRTNFFELNGKTLITPPANTVLEGVTRHYIIKVAKDNGFEVLEQPILLDKLNSQSSYFVSSTSSKIMPLNKIDTQNYSISTDLKMLMARFDEFLDKI